MNTESEINVDSLKTELADAHATLVECWRVCEVENRDVLHPRPSLADRIRTLYTRLEAAQKAEAEACSRAADREDIAGKLAAAEDKIESLTRENWRLEQRNKDDSWSNWQRCSRIRHALQLSGCVDYDRLSDLASKIISFLLSEIAIARGEKAGDVAISIMDYYPGTPLYQFIRARSEAFVNPIRTTPALAAFDAGSGG